MCWGGRAAVQADIYMFLTTGDGDCLVTIEVGLLARMQRGCERSLEQRRHGNRGP